MGKDEEENVYKYRDEEWLEKKYKEEGWSQTEIADYCGVTQGTIYDWMKRHDIEARSISAANEGESNGHWVDSPVKDYDWMYRMYVQEEKSLRDIADATDVSLKTVQRWVNNHDISTRSPNRPPEDLKRSDNPNWKGGKPQCKNCGREISYGESSRCWACYSKLLQGRENPNYSGELDFTASLRSYSKSEWRPKIFERDNYTCRECGDDDGGNLHAHHIIPFTTIRDQIIMENATDFDLNTEEGRESLLEIAKEDDRINDLENGVTLCEDCHRAEHRRIKELKDDKVYRYYADILEVIDADTLKVRIDLGFDTYIDENIRLYGVDAPDIDSSDIHRDGKVLDVGLILDEVCRPGRQIQIRTYKSGKYGRWLALVILEGSAFNKYLVESELASKYFI